ncbi:MAG TPA: BON domain-containing protein [Longimicrobiaceae bacterium]|nr:BON domain-containing protein [Longimicrobiaceae bacterium]
MARYDGGWGRFPGRAGYDGSYGPPRPLSRPGGFTRGGPGSPGYDTGFRGYAGYGADFQWGPQAAGEGDSGDAGTVYGPARYGLGPYYERLRRQRRPDDELKEEVEEALFYDTWVDADAITVEVKDGIVTLRGELPDYDEIRYATDDAWDVEGVRGVRSELMIRGEGEDTAGDAADRETGAAARQGGDRSRSA